jgi:glutaminyl-tRNA synthetase
MSSEQDEVISIFHLGEEPKKQITKNANLVTSLKALSTVLDISTIDTKLGQQLFSIVSALPDPKNALIHQHLASYVTKGRLPSPQQVTAAIAFCKNRPGFNVLAIDQIKEFETACGADVFITEDQIKTHAKEIVELYKDQLKDERYLFVMGNLMLAFKEETTSSNRGWLWAEGKIVKSAIDAEVLALLGPRGPEDEIREAEIKAARKAAGKIANKPTPPVSASVTATKPSDIASTAASLPTPPTSTLVTPTTGETGFDARILASAINSPELKAQHLSVTGGVVRSRFPPEPNGYLHIGHAKSMNLNFEGVFRELKVLDKITSDGKKAYDTTFRYDDTNPDAESQEYIDNQAENVAWMGWKPARVTHSSDYFNQLFEYAVALIKMGKAFVCHQTKADIEVSREFSVAMHKTVNKENGDEPIDIAALLKKAESPWRHRPIEESLRAFYLMRDGFFVEGSASLRLKIDMTSVNPTLWDPVAYRIKYTPHPHTGRTWCIYPSYDFSHCIIDSIEHIDYSLCTLEFEVRRDLYYWVLEQLNIWRPHVWEFARLEITYVQLSKRKILKLVNDGTVRGWDDPRIPTINGLRRRGYTAEAINAFCRDIGVTRNHNQVDYRKLEHHVRLHLDGVAKRHFLVLDPIPVHLINVPADYLIEVEAPDFPRDATLGMHKLSLSNIVYIDRDDFRLEDDPSYYGLAPNKYAGLRYAGYVKIVGVETNEKGLVTSLKGEYDHGRSASAGKVKGNLHWVSGSSPGQVPPTVQVRLYEHLFTTETPGSTGDWESELNTHSEVVLNTAVAPLSLVQSTKAGDRFQFERAGYFVCDKDSGSCTVKDVNGRPVFNLIVALKESVETKKIKGGK